MRRRQFIGTGAGAVALGAVALMRSHRALAESIEVPISMQVELLSKVVRYDRNMAGRVHGAFTVLGVVGTSTVSARKAAAQLERAFEDSGSVADAKVAFVPMDYASPEALRGALERERPALIVFTPGLSAAMPDIAHALDGSDVLSASVVASDVPRGAVVGFAQESSRPKIWVNLAQAKRQNVDFPSRFLGIARVV